jgi:hypothetical protein
MPLNSHNRDITDTSGIDSKVNYQQFEHEELDMITFAFDGRAEAIPIGTKYPVSVRVMCPDIRVVSRLACIFLPVNPNYKKLYNLATLKSDIIAYRCCNAKSRIARVGEIIGKNGIPYEFPKSDIDGIAFQNDDDMPWIDVDMNLAFPGVAGTWSFFYHATSNNKLKAQEWQGYITRVTMSVQNQVGVIRFNQGEE